VVLSAKAVEICVRSLVRRCGRQSVYCSVPIGGCRPGDVRNSKDVENDSQCRGLGDLRNCLEALSQNATGDAKLSLERACQALRQVDVNERNRYTHDSVADSADPSIRDRVQDFVRQAQDALCAVVLAQHALGVHG